MPKGPETSVFTAGLLLAMLAGIIWRVWRSGGSARARIVSVWAPLAVLLVGGLFLLSATRLEGSASFRALTLHAILCWSALLTMYAVLYDGLARVAARFGVRLWTRYAAVNVALVWLVGSRLMSLLLIGLGPLGFRLSVALIAVGVATYAALFFGKPLRTDDDLGLETPRATSHPISNGVYWSLVALVVGVAAILILLNIYRPVSLWDTYTHWLIIPHEILVNDRMAGFYELTRSVAPGYSPQQSVDSALLLFFWGDANLSENLLNALNPLAFTLGLWVMLDVLRRRVGTALLALSLAVALIVFVHLSVTYRVSVYSDMRGVLAILLAGLGFLVVREFPQKAASWRGAFVAVIPLALLSTVVLSFKPYAWPLAFAPLAALVCSGYGWRYWAAFLAAAFAITVVEIVPFQLLAPDIQIFELISVTSRISETLAKAVSPDIPALLKGLRLHAGTFPVFLLLSGLAVLSIAASFFVAARPERAALQTSGFMALGLLGALLAAMNLSPAFANSFARYQPNLFLLALATGVLLLGLAFRKLRPPVVAPVLGSLMAMAATAYLVKAYPTSSAGIENERQFRLMETATPFPPQGLLRNDYLARVKPLDGDKPVRIIANAHVNGLSEFYYNYTLARHTRNVLSIAHPTRDPMEIARSFATPAEMAAYFDRVEATHLYIEVEETLHGATVAPGLYTVGEFMSRIEAAAP